MELEIEQHMEELTKGAAIYTKPALSAYQQHNNDAAH